MEKIDLIQLVLDQMTDLYDKNTQLSPEERNQLQLEYERNLEKLNQYLDESRKERDKRRQESEPNQQASLLDKLYAQLEDVKEQLVAIQSEEIGHTSHFALPARVRRLEQLLATNALDINACWTRLGELERELGRIK